MDFPDVFGDFLFAGRFNFISRFSNDSANKIAEYLALSLLNVCKLHVFPGILGALQCGRTACGLRFG